MEEKRRIAIITARGGSKRIPGKNIRSFCGKPILAYSVEAARRSGLFEEVMVSTDSEEIAEVAKAAGARVPFMRSDETAGDYATTADVLLEVLEVYEKLGKRFDQVCCIYPTAPFVTPEKLQNAVTVLEETDADSVVPVVRYSFPPQRAFVIRDGLTVMKHPEHAKSRSQDLEPYFHDCGQFYLMQTERFRRKKQIFTDRTVSVEMPETQVQDIDNETDWKLAELKYEMMDKAGR
jgi:N-acylneuraminate cytidylyltransferase